MSNNTNPKGIGGWLFLLIVAMGFLAPLFSLLVMGGRFFGWEHQLPQLVFSETWQHFKSAEWIANVVFCVLSIYGAYQLTFVQTPRSVRFATIILWVNATVGVAALGVIIPAAFLGIDGEQFVRSIGGAIGGSLAAWIWTLYLKKSRRVANTYGLVTEPTITISNEKNQGDPPLLMGAELLGDKKEVDTAGRSQLPASDKSDHEQSFVKVAKPYSQSTPSSNGGTEPRSKPATMAEANAESADMTDDDERFYEMVAKELKDGTMREGLWTKAFALSGGDDTQTRVTYIEFRVKQLANEAHSQARAASERKRIDEEQACGSTKQAAMAMDGLQLLAKHVAGFVQVDKTKESEQRHIEDGKHADCEDSIGADRKSEEWAKTEKLISELATAGFEIKETSPGVWQCQKAGRGTILASSRAELEYAVRMVSGGKW